MNFKRLKWLLFFSFLLLTSLPLLSLGYGNMVNSEAMLRDRSALHLQSIVEKSAQLLQGFLSERVNDLRLLANFLLPLKLEGQTTLAEERLAMVMQQYGVYKGFLLLDSNGKALASINEEYFGPGNFNEMKWFQDAIAGKDQFETVVLNDPKQRAALQLSTPVFLHKTDKTKAVLVSLVDLTPIERRLSETMIEKTGEAYLVDHLGRFLTSTRFGVKPMSHRIDLVEYRQLCGEGSVCRRLDYRGVSVLSTAMTLPDTKWTVIVEQDWKEISQQLSDIRRRFLFWGFIFVAVEMMVAYFISSQIARMLERSYQNEKELESQVLQQEKLVTMGLLTAGMAHELNTPIANALVYTQMLIEEMSNRQVSSESLEKLQTIEEEIHQISRIVRNLLEFSRRPQKGEEHTDVAALLSRLLEIAKINETYPDVKIIVDHQNNLPPAHADPSILKQVFGNLIANALDAMPEGGTLRITTRLVKELKKIKVDVTDTGRGIPAEDIDKVFQPFFTTKSKKDGMGLGLFVGYGMIRRLGGNIKVISNQRKETAAGNTSSGTTFTVELPILDMASTGHGLQEDKEGQA